MTDYKAEIDVLREKIEALWRREQEFRNRQRTLYQQWRTELEAQAGDIQAGDIIVIKEGYGDARLGRLARVTSCGVSEDHTGRPCITIAIDFWDYESMTVPITIAVRVPDERAKVLWERLASDNKELYQLVRDKLDRHSTLW